MAKTRNIEGKSVNYTAMTDKSWNSRTRKPSTARQWHDRYVCAVTNTHAITKEFLELAFPM
jgi:hypothetical protein